MEDVQEETLSSTPSELRLVLIGARWAGKSSSANTILGKEQFECGRIRTTQAEAKHEVVEGRKLILVDAPGWSSSRSISEIPEGDKQRFKLHASKCPPGPNAFLLVVPIDSAFSVEQRATVEEHMKLLGERAWRFTMVLFSYGDFLGEKTIEQHIESEGQALKWLVGRCENRYHVLSNKDKSNWSQVSQLLEKIDEMVFNNGGKSYEVDDQTFKIIKEKQQMVAERAKERQRRAEEQRQDMATLIPEGSRSIPDLRMVLLGSRGVGKTSVGNTILGFNDQESGKRTQESVLRKGFVEKTEIAIVDTPGWWKGFLVCDTPEVIKDELKRSMFLCPPGPHVFLLVVDADASFSAKHLDAVKEHMELLGKGVWRHTIVIFTRGDWLGRHTIEEYIEGEGQALQSLVEQCGNRYYVLNNKCANDGPQVTELLQMITWTVAGNSWGCFVPDQKMLETIEERQRKVEEGAILRQSQVRAKRKFLSRSKNKLQELRIVMLGQKTCGKSATGNTILRKEVFSANQSEQCRVEVGQVEGRLVTVIDTPGWWKESSSCTEHTDTEIVRGLSLTPSGVHAVLLVVPLDLKFREAQRVTVEEQMNVFDANIWKHTMVLFTYGDRLEDKSIEDHIEREHPPLRWLIEKCENKYHTVNNMKKSDVNQVTELFEKLDEMVAANRGAAFCLDMTNTKLRLSDKIRRRKLKQVLEQRLESECRRREVTLMIGFKEKLLELQDDIRQSVTSTKPKSQVGDMTKFKSVGIGQWKKYVKDKEEKLCEKISLEVEKLDKDIRRSTVGGSMDALMPEFSRDGPGAYFTETFSQPASNFDKVLSWLSHLHINTNVDNQLTLNFSQTSGYGSDLFN